MKVFDWPWSLRKEERLLKLWYKISYNFFCGYKKNRKFEVRLLLNMEICHILGTDGKERVSHKLGRREYLTGNCFLFQVYQELNGKVRDAVISLVSF